MTITVSDAWARMSRGMIPEIKMGQVSTWPDYPGSLCSKMDADQLGNKLGYSPDVYYGLPNGRDLVILGAPDPSLWGCGIEGQAWQTGTGLASGGLMDVRYSNATTTVWTITHELGHTFGLGHAGGLFANCNTDNWDGPFTRTDASYPGFCNVNQNVEYGDRANIMGSNGTIDKADLNGHQKYVLGLIQPGAGLIEATASADEQLFTIHDLHTSDLDLPQAIRMTADDPDGSGPCAAPVYDIGYDPALGGVRVLRVRIANDCGGRTLYSTAPETISWMTPEPPNQLRRYFLPGESQLTSSGKVQIKVVRADPVAGTATVSIRRTDVPGFSSLQVTSRNLAASNPMAATGGTLIGVVTTNQAGWSATSDASWVTVTSSGTTGQRLILSAEQNTTTDKRTATVTVRAGTETRTYTVVQNPGDPSLAGDCGATPVSYCTIDDVNTEVSSSIETAGDTDWFKFTAPAAGTYRFSSSQAPDNPVPSLTVDLLTPDGRTLVDGGAWMNGFTILAYLDAGQTCFLQVGSGSTGNYTVTATYSPRGIEVSPPYAELEAGQTHLTVTVRTGGDWEFKGGNWTTASPASGTGNTTVELTTEAHPTRTRIETLPFTASGLTATLNIIIPAGTAGNLSVAPPSLSAAAGGDSQTVQITTDGAWQLTTPSWVSASQTSGTGSTPVSLTIQENSTGQARTESVRVTGSGREASVAITQPAKPKPVETLSVDPATIDAAATGDTQTVRITASGDWIITAPSMGGTDWVTVSPLWGTGDTNVQITTKANTSGQPRTGYVTVTSGTMAATVTVTQPARTTLTLSTTAYNPGGGGGKTWVTVTSDSPWQAKAPDWIAVKPEQGYPNWMVVEVTANFTDTNRIGAVVVTAGDLTVTLWVNQPPGPRATFLSVPEKPRILPPGGGYFSSDVSTNGAWQATTEPWLTVSPSSGIGGAYLIIIAAPNTTGATRTTWITFTTGNQTARIPITQYG